MARRHSDAMAAAGALRLPLSLLLALLLSLLCACSSPVADASKLRALHATLSDDGGDAMQLSDAELAAAAAAHAGAPAVFSAYDAAQPPGTIVHHVALHAPHEIVPHDLHVQQHQPEGHHATQGEEGEEHEQQHDEHETESQAQHHLDVQAQQQHFVPAAGDSHDALPAELNREPVVARLPEYDDIRVAKAPQHVALHLSCSGGGGGLLHIIDTSYGQGQGSPDPRTGVIPKGYCHAPLDVTGSGCQSKAECTVSAAHITAPSGVEDNDPCPGVFKRTVVTYTCVEHSDANHPDPDHAIPPIVHPVGLEHSPEIRLHTFLPPAHFAEGAGGGMGRPGAPPPGMVEFFAHFFHKQQHSRFPFRGSRRGGAHGESSCEADAHRLCGGVLKQCVGDFACPLLGLCITDQMAYLSPDCRAAHPCAPDVEARCRADAHGAPFAGNGLVQCLASHALNAGHGGETALQTKCTELHPCLADNTCEMVDYDSNYYSAHSPVMRNIPEYMELLHAARTESLRAGDGVTERAIELPFLHLVLPSVERLESYGHGGAAAEEEGADAHDSDAHDAHAYAGQMHQQQQQADHASEPDSSHPQLDKSTLGTGQLSQIALAAHPRLVVNVDAREHPDGERDGGELQTNLWTARAGAPHQLFDLNHFGQVFWVHDPNSHLHAGEEEEDGVAQGKHGVAPEHFCLTAHVGAPAHRQVVSLPCVHDTVQAADSVHLPDTSEARAQLWKFEGGLLHHLASALCLEHRPESVVAGSTLQLSRCSPASAAQRWNWESGAHAERNPAVFDEHLAAVEEHRRVFHAQQAQRTQQLRAQHQAAQMRAAVQHPNLVSQMLEEEQASNGAEVADLRYQHAALLAREQRDHLDEEAHVARLEDQVDALAQREHAELAEEREQRLLLQREVHGDSERLHHLEMSLAAQRAAAAAAAAAASPSSDEDQTHFLTPTTLLLSMGLVAVLAAAFRKFLFPRLFKKRYSPMASQHYYSSHAF